MHRSQRSILRVSIGLTATTVDALKRALEARYGPRQICPMERGSFMEQAIRAYSSAIVQAGKDYDASMLACDVRHETDEEFALRVGEPRHVQRPLPPDNVIQLFA